MRALWPYLGLALLALCGCASSIDRAESQQLLAHEIVIPREFRWGKSNPAVLSSAERYLDAYEQSWWACVKDFSDDIDHHPTVEDRAGNGWPATIAGAADGYTAAEKQIRKIRTQYGDQKAQALLKEALKFPE